MREPTEPIFSIQDSSGQQSLYLQLDAILIVLLLLLGWEIEWNYHELPGWPPLVLDYSIIFAPVFFFIFYFLTVRNRTKVSSDAAILKPIGRLCVLFGCIVLAERIVNSFQDTLLNWKAYYFLFLLPCWGWLGFEIAGNSKRTLKLIRELARLGAIAAYISYGMTIVGIAKDSPFGPMDWPYRFVIIFGFFYFLTSMVTGIQRDRGTPFWLFGCSLAVFWGVYKFTIVCTFLGVFAWAAFLLAKGYSYKFRSILSFSLIVLVAVIALIALDNVSGGHVFNAVNDIVQKRWLKNVKSIDLKRVNDLSGSRLVIWMQMIPRIESHPLLGTGMGQVYYGTKVTHNGYIDLLLSYGFLGTGVFFTGLFIWVRSLGRSQPTREILLIVLTSVGYIGAILASNLFGSVWIQFHTICAYTMLAGGISYRLSRRATA